MLVFIARSFFLLFLYTETVKVVTWLHARRPPRQRFPVVERGEKRSPDVADWLAEAARERDGRNADALLQV